MDLIHLAHDKHHGWTLYMAEHPRPLCCPSQAVVWRWTELQQKRSQYTRIISTKSPSPCVTTFRASLRNLTARLPQSCDRSCYVSRPILAPPPLWLQKHADLRAYDFAHPPSLWQQTRLALGFPVPEAGASMEFILLYTAHKMRIGSHYTNSNK